MRGSLYRGVKLPMPKTQILTLAAALLFQSSLFAMSEEPLFTVEVKDQAPPSDVPDHVKGLLDPKVYVISDDEGVWYEFWFVKEILFDSKPADTKAAIKMMGEAFPVLGYVGIAEAELCYDFRDDPIDPGHYVLRGSFQPENGDHLGTSPHHSGFMLFMPWDKDTDDLANYSDREDMWELSLEDTEVGHPPILNLQALDSVEGEFPRIEENEEEEWSFLTLNLPGMVGGEAFDIPVRLVIEGMGELD